MSQDLQPVRDVFVHYKPDKTLAQFHLSDEFIRCLIGPFGSGKSTACCFEILRSAALMQPCDDGVKRARWVVARNSYRELKDTTIATWSQWIPDVLQTWRPSDMMTTVKVPGVLELEVLFRSLDSIDDVKKLLSLEVTGAWMNEAREIPRAIFDALQGRVGRHKPPGFPRDAWAGVILDTNSCDTDHWIYRVFEEQRPLGFKIFHQPSGLSPEAENVDNLPTGYYERLARGKDKAWVDVYVHGQYGFVIDGKPIYPEYNDQVHCAKDEIDPVEGVPLIIGIDFGLTPAATISQEVAGQWRVIDELVTEDMGAKRFGDQLSKLLNGRYAGFMVAPSLYIPEHVSQGHSFVQQSNMRIWGDPAGEQRAQTDERTPFQILHACGINAVPAPSNDFTLRRESVANRLTRLDAGRPAFLLSPRCNRLRKAMGGGYQFRRLKVSGDERFADVIDKNAHSHVAESLQYAMIGEGEGRALVGTNDRYCDPAVRINLERGAGSPNGRRGTTLGPRGRGGVGV